MRTLRGAHAERRVEVTIDARDHQQRSRDLEAEVQALRAEVRRLRVQLGLRRHPHLDEYAWVRPQ